MLHVLSHLVTFAKNVGVPFCQEYIGTLGSTAVEQTSSLVHFDYQQLVWFEKCIKNFI